MTGVADRPAGQVCAVRGRSTWSKLKGAAGPTGHREGARGAVARRRALDDAGGARRRRCRHRRARRPQGRAASTSSTADRQALLAKQRAVEATLGRRSGSRCATGSRADVLGGGRRDVRRRPRRARSAQRGLPHRSRASTCGCASPTPRTPEAIRRVAADAKQDALRGVPAPRAERARPARGDRRRRFAEQPGTSGRPTRDADPDRRLGPASEGRRRRPAAARLRRSNTTRPSATRSPSRSTS